MQCPDGSYRRALAVDPARPITLRNLAHLSYIARRYNEARYWADSALVIDPGFFEAYYMRAPITLRLGQVEQARRDGEMAMRFSAGAPEAGLPLVLVDLRAGDTARLHPKGGELWFRLRQPDFEPLRAHPRFQRLVEESRPR